MEVFFFLCIALVFIGIISSAGKDKVNNINRSRNTAHNNFRSYFITLPDDIRFGFMNNLEEQQRLQFEQMIHNVNYECSEEMIDRYNKWAENKEDKSCDTHYCEAIEENNDYTEPEEGCEPWETEDTCNSDDSSAPVD
jgi:hypothetical protein